MTNVGGKDDDENSKESKNIGYRVADHRKDGRHEESDKTEDLRKIQRRGKKIKKLQGKYKSGGGRLTR